MHLMHHSHWPEEPIVGPSHTAFTILSRLSYSALFFSSISVSKAALASINLSFASGFATWTTQYIRLKSCYKLLCDRIRLSCHLKPTPNQTIKEHACMHDGIWWFKRLINPHRWVDIRRELKGRFAVCWFEIFYGGLWRYVENIIVWPCAWQRRHASCQ